MAGNGFAPSGKAQKAARNHLRDTVKADGLLGGFPLPEGVLGVDDDGNTIQWHPMTVAWWEAWRVSPQGTRMVTDVDWGYLLDTARLHHHLWTGARFEVAAELRLRVAKFGATPEDRARLRYEIDPEARHPSMTSTTPVPRQDARRARYLNSIPAGTTTPHASVTRITPETERDSRPQSDEIPGF